MNILKRILGAMGSGISSLGKKAVNNAVKSASKKLKKAMWITIGVVAFIVFCGIYSFGSSLQISEIFKDKSKEYYDVTTSEEILIKAIESGEVDSEAIGQSMLSKKDLLTILQAVADYKDPDSPYGAKASKIRYQYYREKYCVVQLEWEEEETVTITDYNGNEHSKTTTVKRRVDLSKEYFNEEEAKAAYPDHADATCVWGWVPEYVWSDESLYTNEEYEQNYTVNWQLIYALALMASQENNNEWYDSPGDDGSGVIIRYRIDEDVLQDIIDVFRPRFVYAYNAAASKSMKKVQQAVYMSKAEADRLGYLYDPNDPLIEETAKVTVLMDKYAVQVQDYDWDSLEKISYVVESDGIDINGYDGGGNWLDLGDEHTKQMRNLKKIPATSLIGVYNAYMSKTVNTSINTADVAHGVLIGADKYKYFYYGLQDNRTLLNYECDYQNNRQFYNTDPEGGDFGGGTYMADPQVFYRTVRTLVHQFEFDHFIDILETLPETETMIAEYKLMWEKFEKGEKLYKELEPNEYPGVMPTENHGMLKHHTYQDVILGSLRNDIFSEDGTYIIPDLDEFDAESEVFRPLDVSDNLTLEQIQYLFDNFAPIAGKHESLFKEPNVANKLLELQNKYNVSILGLLAIACNESAYGTSPLCIDYWNFIGWGAFDSNPREGESKFGNFKAISGNVADALYKNFEKIILNYTLRNPPQNSYYTMRFNNGTHQYCTSLTWPATNATIRRQMEMCLGIYSGGDGGVIGPIPIGGSIIEDFSLPLNQGVYKVSSHFGHRVLGGNDQNHKGIDLACSEGTPIYSAGAATVEIARYSTSAGYWVVLNHGTVNGQILRTKYMHMMNMPPVVEGQVVGQGEIIGYSGNTGASTGPHLHFSVTLNGIDGDVDPEQYFSF